MTTKVTAAEAKAKFAECLRSAEKGDSVVITRHGKDVAVLISPERHLQVQRIEASRKPGGLAALAGGWEGSDELYRIVKRIRRTGPRAAPKFE